MVYDRNKGVESILKAWINKDLIENYWETRALFNTVNGKIKHNLPNEARDEDFNWLYFYHGTYPVYENNTYVGYCLGYDWCEPDKE
jgi:uncharacterized protein YndB with AHSA1/START domain